MEKIFVQGKTVLVSDIDFLWLVGFKWYLNGGYAVRTDRGKTVRMHRLILEQKLGHNNFEETDHINRNRLDNQRENLRPATHQENQGNQGKHRNNTSGGYKGVFANGRRWVAKIKIDGRSVYLGTYDTPEEAARAYNRAAIEHFGEYACLNEVT